MKTTVNFLLTMIVLFVFTITFTSCQKEKEQGWLPAVKEYFKCPTDSTTFVTITDGDKVYELHDMGNGKKFVKFISGFPQEFIGEQLLNEKAYSFYKGLVHRNLLTFEDWKNWFKRNREEGFNFHLKNMGMFLLPPSGEGSFVCNNEAFVAWAYCGPATYWKENLFSGIPSEWLPDKGAYRLEWFCSLPIMDN